MKVPQNAREGDWQGRRALFYNNRIIVKFKPVPEGAETTAQELVESVRRAIPNGVLLRPPKATGRVLYGVDPATDVVALANELSQRPDVEYAELNPVIAICATPNDPGHGPHFQLTQKVGGKTVTQNLPSPAALRKAEGEITEFRQFQSLTSQLVEVNRKVCRLRPVEKTEQTPREKKRPKRSAGKSRAN